TTAGLLDIIHYRILLTVRIQALDTAMGLFRTLQPHTAEGDYLLEELQPRLQEAYNRLENTDVAILTRAKDCALIQYFLQQQPGDIQLWLHDARESMHLAEHFENNGHHQLRMQILEMETTAHGQWNQAFA